MLQTPALQLLRLIHVDRIRRLAIVFEIDNRATLRLVVPQDIPKRTVVGRYAYTPDVPV